MGAVDVGDEVHAQALALIGRECRAHHLRTEIGAADADVDHIRDALAGMSAPVARTHAPDEGLHPRQHAVDQRHHVLTLDLDRTLGAVAQCDVQHGALLGVVDRLALEHTANPALEIDRLGQLDQPVQRLAGDEILGIIEMQSGDGQTHGRRALGVGIEQIAHPLRTHRLPMPLECLPLGCLVHEHGRHDGSSLLKSGITGWRRI